MPLPPTRLMAPILIAVFSLPLQAAAPITAVGVVQGLLSPCGVPYERNRFSPSTTARIEAFDRDVRLPFYADRSTPAYEARLRELSPSTYSGDGEAASRFFAEKHAQRDALMAEARRRAAARGAEYDARVKAFVSSIPVAEQMAVRMLFVPKICIAPR